MRIRHPLINSTLSAGMTRSFRMLFRTLRIEYDFFVNDTNPYQIAQGPTYIYSVWHDSMVVPVFAGKQPATMALVGQHNDGSYVANVLKSAGIPSARGSSSKGGAATIRKLIDETDGDVQIGLSENKRLGTLTERQRLLLVERLGG